MLENVGFVEKTKNTDTERQWLNIKWLSTMRIWIFYIINIYIMIIIYSNSNFATLYLQLFIILLFSLIYNFTYSIILVHLQ